MIGVNRRYNMSRWRTRVLNVYVYEEAGLKKEKQHKVTIRHLGCARVGE